MFRKILSFLFVLFFALSLCSCAEEEKDDDGPSSGGADLGPSVIDDYEQGEATQSESNDMAKSIMTTVDNAFANVKTTAARAEGDQTIDWSSSDGRLTITGNFEMVDNSNYSYDLTLTFRDYDDGSMQLNGVIRYKYDYVISDSSCKMIMNYSGDFKLGFENKKYDYSWDIDMVMTMSVSGGFDMTYECEGTYTCNGQTCDFDYDAARKN